MEKFFKRKYTDEKITKMIEFSYWARKKTSNSRQAHLSRGIRISECTSRSEEKWAFETTSYRLYIAHNIVEATKWDDIIERQQKCSKNAREEYIKNKKISKNISSWF